MLKTLNGTLAGAWLYKRAASRRGQAPAKQTLWTRIKRSTQSRAKRGVRRYTALRIAPYSPLKNYFELLTLFHPHFFAPFAFGRRILSPSYFDSFKPLFGHFAVILRIAQKASIRSKFLQRKT